MLRSTSAILLIAAASACGAANPAAPQVPLDMEITLAPGETAALKDADLRIGFVEVAEDSRCPSDAQCVWAGEVKVRLSLRRGQDEATRQDVREGDAASLDAYRVVVVRVLPQPVSTRPTRPEDYRTTLKVTPAAIQ